MRGAWDTRLRRSRRFRRLWQVVSDQAWARRGAPMGLVAEELDRDDYENWRRSRALGPAVAAARARIMLRRHGSCAVQLLRVMGRRSRPFLPKNYRLMRRAHGVALQRERLLAVEAALLSAA